MGARIGYHQPHHDAGRAPTPIASRQPRTKGTTPASTPPLACSTQATVRPGDIGGEGNCKVEAAG